MNEEKRLCVGCGKELYEFVDICPYCQADNRESKKVEEELKDEEERRNARNGKDLSLKVYDGKPIELKEYKEELKGKRALFIFLFPIFFLIFLTSVVLIFLTVVGVLNDTKSAPSLFASIPLIIVFLGLAVFSIRFLIIKLIELIKYRRLFYEGIVIKNLPYEVIESKEDFDNYRNIKVKASYVDKDGKKLLFEGKIVDDDLDKHEVCDVIYNPKKPEEYIMMSEYMY